MVIEINKLSNIYDSSTSNLNLKVRYGVLLNYTFELKRISNLDITMNFECILACDYYLGIGRNGDIPWRGTPIANADMKWFSKMTSAPNTAVIMGRKTMESIPAKFFPLVGRVNIVLSRANVGITVQGSLTASPIIHAGSFEAALDWCNGRYDHVFVIGGAKLYDEAFKHPMCKCIWMTQIKLNYECDTFIDDNALEGYFTDRAITLRFGPYEFPEIVQVLMRGNRVNSSLERKSRITYGDRCEKNYIWDLRGFLHHHSDLRPNRTGIPTLSTFAKPLTFKLSDEYGLIMPLLTTKAVSFKSVAIELIWFLRGSTNTKYLKENDVSIWDANSSREFLDSRGLTECEEGHVGPIYGSQWRDWNNESIDQLADVIERIKKDPTDRRLLVSAWNPSQIDKMVLPPCHYCFQFYVGFKDGKPSTLSCLVNMRSADMALGVPFNIASYALLTHMVAQITHLTPYELIIMMGDCHVYQNHLEAIAVQVQRAVLEPPSFRFSQRILDNPNLSIDDFAWRADMTDFIVVDYFPHPAIKMDMAV